MGRVVVAVEDHVEARHLTSNLARGVVEQTVGFAAVVYARVKQSHDHVGTLLLLHLVHPLACCLHGVLEAEAAPQLL